MLTAERAIHFAIFVFLLIGLSSLSAWVSYTYLTGHSHSGDSRHGIELGDDTTSSLRELQQSPLELVEQTVTLRKKTGLLTPLFCSHYLESAKNLPILDFDTWSQLGF